MNLQRKAPVVPFRGGANESTYRFCLKELDLVSRDRFGTSCK